jgi:competence protein ComFC
LKPSFRRLLSSWGKTAELLFFPSFCELCRALLEKPGEKVICRRCREKVRRCSASFCPCCGRFFESEVEPHFCRTCLEKEPALSKHRSFARYEGPVKEVILLFKYRGFKVLGHWLGDLLAESLGNEEDLWEGVDAVVPVPLHPRKEKKRGFNQAQVLAKRLAKHKSLSLLEHRLIKVANIPAQTSLEAEEREKNVRGAFRIKKARDLEKRIVLLVDDVYTTGSTLRECSLVLKKAGATEVRAVTVAQA